MTGPDPWAHLRDTPRPRDMEEFVIFQSADYRPSNHPLYAHEWPDLLAQAKASLASRQQAYPDWVKRNRLSQEDADRDIRAWELIVAEWQWIITSQGEAPGRETHPDRCAAVDLSLKRIDAELRRGNRSHDIYRQCHLALALRWHLSRHLYGEPAIHRIARFNHDLRREREAATRKEKAA